MQIHLENKLDVQLIERKLAELWGQSSDTVESDLEEDQAVLRARVANLVVFVPGKEMRNEVSGVVRDLTTIHPSRVLTLIGDEQAPDKDIEIFVESLCQTDKNTGAKRVCGEEVTITAQGKFVIELPSASIPLLVSDLSTFFWWRDRLSSSHEVLSSLLNNADRLIVDSAEFRSPKQDLIELSRVFKAAKANEVGISDLNWARLTLWRGLLADFYDVPVYASALAAVKSVQINFIGAEHDAEAIAPQALLFAGWLASRLGWTITDTRTHETSTTVNLINRDGSPITVELNRRERENGKPGRLVRVELRCDKEGEVSFIVTRSEDNRHIVAEARFGTDTQHGRVLPVRNRSLAQLLGREMEILTNDDIYQQALSVGVEALEG
jgi:glucose-6-phosphate dehydrogenase assembly protein OpcA